MAGFGKRSKGADDDKIVIVTRVQAEDAGFHIIGKNLCYNAMSQKGIEELIFPKAKSRSERGKTLRCDPYLEFRDSAYTRKDDEEGPTRLLLPQTMFKTAMISASTAGSTATKTDLYKMLRYDEPFVDVYGLPQIYMAVVRLQGMGRPPAIRTRAVLRDWYCFLRFNYIVPQLNFLAVGTLLANAGELNGVGDARPQKGHPFGRFEVVEPGDPRIAQIKASGRMQQQDAAFDYPTPFDKETKQYLKYFDEESSRREMPSQGRPKPPQPKKKAA